MKKSTKYILYSLLIIELLALVIVLANHESSFISDEIDPLTTNNTIKDNTKENNFNDYNPTTFSPQIEPKSMWRGKIVGITIVIVTAFYSLIIPLTLIIMAIKNKKNNNKASITYTIFALVYFFFGQVISGIANTIAKPIIYLYPQKETEVKVSLGYSDKVTCTYPKYDNGWNVIAKPTGDLIDLKNGKKLYSLYWESKDVKKMDIKEGFCVKGEDSAKFLEEKLALLGLNYREAEEFIVYWLPELEKNKYNLIRFETIDEINNSMPLEITPKPDTLIRVLMDFKPSNKYVNLTKQQLKTPERRGFVAVEWGGRKNASVDTK